MLPHLGMTTRASAVVAALTAVVPGGVASAGTPNNDVPVAYPATSTTSTDSIVSTARRQGQGATGARWAKNQYLSTKKPTPTSYSGGSGKFCALGPLKSSRESRLKPDKIRDQRALNHRYPLVKAFHRLRDSVGYRGEGRNLACMITDSTMDWNIAKWVGATTHDIGRERGHLSAHLDGGGASEGWRPTSTAAPRLSNRWTTCMHWRAATAVRLS